METLNPTGKTHTQKHREDRESLHQSSEQFCMQKQKHRSKKALIKKKKASSTIHLVVIRKKLPDGKFALRMEKKVGTVNSQDPQIIRRIANKQRRDFMESLSPHGNVPSLPAQDQLVVMNPSQQQVQRPEPLRQSWIDFRSHQQYQWQQNQAMMAYYREQLQALQHSAPQQLQFQGMMAEQLLTREHAEYAERMMREVSIRQQQNPQYMQLVWPTLPNQ